ncbi:MAG: sigma-70 family RNA polymerase sigma factor [Nanoarchaeota archaeon]
MVAELDIRRTGYANLQDLCRDNYAPVFSFVYKMALDQTVAADITQDTFAKIAEKIGQFQPQGENPKTDLQNWLFASAKNKYINNLHKKKIENAYLMGVKTALGDETANLHSEINSRSFIAGASAVVEESTNPEEELLSEERKKYMQASLESITNESRLRMAQLWFSEGRTYLEISKLMGIPIGTVMSGLNRAKKEMRDRFHKSYE